LVFFGLHYCDTHAIKYLDKVFLSEPIDPYYKARRENLIVVSVECTKCDEYCFCESLETFYPAEGVVDLDLKPYDKYYLVRSLSEKGDKIIEANRHLFKEINVKWEKRKFIQKGLEKNVLEKLDVALISKSNVSKIVEDCALCQVCTVTCPTCYCFDIIDEPVPEKAFTYVRVRRRSSCMGLYYSRLAGDVIILKTKEDRFKWRLLHKFVFSRKMYGMYGCTGCGRCIRYCHSRIDFRDFLNGLVGGDSSG